MLDVSGTLPTEEEVEVVLVVEAVAETLEEEEVEEDVEVGGVQPVKASEVIVDSDSGEGAWKDSSLGSAQPY